jgi:hypothetical protein
MRRCAVEVELSMWSRTLDFRDRLYGEKDGRTLHCYPKVLSLTMGVLLFVWWRIRAVVVILLYLRRFPHYRLHTLMSMGRVSSQWLRRRIQRVRHGLNRITGIIRKFTSRDGGIEREDV